MTGRAPCFSMRSTGSSKAGCTKSAMIPRRAAIALGEALCIAERRRLCGGLACDQVDIAPERHAVAAPIQRERPARQRLAGIPFALPVMQQRARRKAPVQAADQIVGADALLRTERGGVPFRRLVIVDRHESRLAAHGQADIVGGKIGVDFFAERIQRRPSLVGERHGHARLLGDARDVHVEGKRDFARLDHAGDRRGRTVVRRGRHRQMTFPA